MVGARVRRQQVTPIPAEEIGGDPVLIQKDEVGRVEG